MPVPYGHRLETYGMNPDGEGESPFWVDRLALEQIEEFGPAWRFDDAKLLEDAIQRPRIVYQNLKRPGFHDGFAYCYDAWEYLSPARRDEEPHLAEFVFIVYVRPISGGYLIVECAWRRGNPRDRGKPNDETHFGDVSWQRS